MARIRTIKPEFWTDEKLSECSLSARLLFVGLISHADDEGRLEYSPTRTRLQLFPCGKVTHGELIEWFCELNERSLIRLYKIDSKEFLDIPGFSKHQRINRPTPSRLPAFLNEHSMSIHGVLTSGMEGNGKERKGAKSIRRKPHDDPDWLAEFKALYPKRAGDYNWRGAIQASHARIKEGHTSKEFLDGARRYHEFCRITGSLGTQYVKQAAAFLGPGKPFLERWDPPDSKPPAGKRGTFDQLFPQGDA